MNNKAKKTARELEILNDDDEDLRLAQESLEEYRANPESAIPWETLYKETLQKFGYSVADTIKEGMEKPSYFADNQEDVQLAQEALDEYLANPSIGIDADSFFAEETKRLQNRQSKD